MAGKHRDRLKPWQIRKRTVHRRIKENKPIDWHMVAIAEYARPDISRRDIAYLFKYDHIPEKPLRILLKMNKNTLLNATMLYENGKPPALRKGYPHEFNGDPYNMHILLDSNAREWIKQRLFTIIKKDRKKIPERFMVNGY